MCPYYLYYLVGHLVGFIVKKHGIKLKDRGSQH